MTDAQAVIRAVNRAEEVYEWLGDRGELRSRRGGGSPGKPGSRPPVNVDLTDLDIDIAALLGSWCLLTSEESGDEMPANQLSAHAAFLRERAIWIAGAEWADDMVSELEGAARKGIGMLGMFMPRTPLPELCSTCEARQWVYHERPPIVRCARGHESQLVEHLQDRGTEVVTQADAAWILGVGRTAVTMAIKRGTLIAGDAGGVTVASVRARLAYARE